MNLDDTPRTDLTKDEIEQIVQDKFYELLAAHEHHQALLGEENIELAKNIITTGAGVRHKAKKEDTRAVVREFETEEDLKDWMMQIPMETLIKYEVVKQDDETYIVY